MSPENTYANDLLASLSTNPVDYAANLLNQQIWCWGRDIECAKGNLLMRYGFQRIAKPNGSESASIYRLNVSPTARIVLRGFGVFWGDERRGGMYVPRFEFTPQLTPQSDLTEPAWSLEDLPPLADPRQDQVRNSHQLLLALIDWIRRYEVWIADKVGIAYRRESLLPWDARHGTTVSAEEMSAAWRALGVAVADHPEHFLLSEKCDDD